MTPDHSRKRFLWGGATVLLASLLAVGAWAAGTGSEILAGAEVNPCAAKTINPCAAKTINPCAAKTLNPCAAKTLNPCAAKTLNPCAAKTLNPCAAKTLNPCGAKAAGNPCNPCNPCGGASVNAAKFVQGDRRVSGRADLALGERLWNDRMLGKSGLACSSCHIEQYGQMNATFKQPYPHRVAMPHQQGGVDQVNAAEMVQFCMLVPMASEPLDWDSNELASLAAYVESIQDGYRPIAAADGNPCNPCGTKNPCNPCGR